MGDVERNLLYKVILNAEHHRSKVKQDHHHKGLVKDLGEDVAPHDGKDEVLGLLDSVLAQLGWVRRLSGESDGSEDIHNQIDPQKLNYSEWTRPNSKTAQKHDENTRKVYRQLEHNELPAVLKDISSPLNRVEDRRKVVVQEDNVCRIFGHRTSRSHAEANVSLF